MILINYVKRYREALGMSQQALADICGVSRNTISSIERYEFCPTVLTAGLICRALGQPFSSVFCLVELPFE